MFQVADSARRTYPSSSGTQRSHSWELDFDQRNQWAKPDQEPTPNAFYSQDDPSIREKYLTQGLGAPCHVSFGFFSRFSG
jgi:hypothetical protein